MRFLARSAGLILALLPLGVAAAQAADVAVSKGELELPDLYRAIACGADVGGACRTAIVKWPKPLRRKLQVHIREPQTGFPPDLVRAVVASVRLAVTEINISGADIQLEVVGKPTAPLQVHMVEAGWDDPVAGTGDPVIDGTKMRTTASAIRLDPATGEIEKASMAVSGNIAPDIIRAAVLKELLRALGLRTALGNRFYTGKSVFAELGHDVQKIRRQDMLALRLHYPTGCARASDCLE